MSNLVNSLVHCLDMGWELADLVTEADIPFETEIARNPNDLTIWLKYYKHKLLTRDAGFKDQVFILQRAVKQFPRSYKLWDSYLLLLEEYYTSNPSVTASLVFKSYQNALILLNKAPILWANYLKFLVKNLRGEIRLIRRTFNQALYNLPVSQHHLIWPGYILFADEIGGKTGVLVYLKFFQYLSPETLRGAGKTEKNEVLSMTIDQIVSKLIEFGDTEHVLVLMKEVLTNVDHYLPLSKSPVQLRLEFIDLLLENRSLKVSEEYDHCIQTFIFGGLKNYKDQNGIFYAKLIMFFIKTKNYDKVRYYSFQGLRSCTTMKDFTLIFDMYTELEQSIVIELESRLEKTPEDQQLLQEANFRMASIEKVLDNRTLMINDMKLRQDTNNLDEWFNRVDIFQVEQQNLQGTLSTFVQALTTINPLKVISVSNKYTLSDFWIKYAQIYAKSSDIRTASLVYSKAIKSQFKTADELANIYISWSEMLLESGDEESSVLLIENVLSTIPNDAGEIDFNDASKSVQSRMHKSIKLWQFYIDLLESMIDDTEKDTDKINKIMKAYDQIIELKIATGQIILNYADFLLNYKYWEKSFTVYEMGIKLFKNHKIKFEIWNKYLTAIIRFSQQNKSSIIIERIRDLFDQCIDSNTDPDHELIPPSLLKPIYILYSQFEQDNGSIMKSIKILESATKKTIEYLRSTKPDMETTIQAKFDIYKTLLFKVGTVLKDTTRLRETYSSILNDDQITLNQLIEITLKFIAFETAQNQFTRVRALFQFVTKLGNPEADKFKKIWSDWEEFEVKHGNESTFKEMLRFKRQVKVEFENDIIIKDSVNPIGFIKGTSTQKEQSPEKNPDAIDIDMDM